MSWNDERVELLSRLWLEGRSASQIANELGQGITRNAVIGKVHRLGLSGRTKATPSVVASRPRPKTAAKPPIERTVEAQSAVDEPVSDRRSVVPLPIERPVATVLNAAFDRVTIMELRETMCRWPLGDPSSTDFRYCGCRTAAGPYCSEHARMAFQPTQERRRVERLARIA